MNTFQLTCFYDGGGDSEFCQGGGAVKHYPAGG